MQGAGRELLYNTFLLYIMVVMGASLTLLFNGPTSHNVAGYIFGVIGVNCNLLLLGLNTVSCLLILGVLHHLAGAQQQPLEFGLQHVYVHSCVDTERIASLGNGSPKAIWVIRPSSSVLLT